MTRKLLDQSIYSSNKRYLALRDDTRFQDKKNFVEELWEKFHPYADPSFHLKIAKSFDQHFWEMYLGCVLLNLNFELISQKRDEGPDLQVKVDNRDLWIEATIATMGTGNDAVPELRENEISEVPEENILLRLTNSIAEKNKKLQTYFSKGIVKQNDLFIVGINGVQITRFLEAEIPYIVKAVLGVGNYFSQIDINTLKTVNDGYQKRDVIKKKNNSPVFTNTFLSGDFPEISGVIYSNTDLWNLPDSLGENFLFVHNLKPNNPINLGWLPTGNEYWVEDDKLRIRSTQ